MKQITTEALIEILGGDRELVVALLERGVIEPCSPERGHAPEHVERALVSRTLVRELDVNYEGVEIILHLRERVLATQRQVGELLEELRRQGKR